MGSAKGSEFTQASSGEGQEGSEQGSPEAECSGGHAGKPDRQRETTFLLVCRPEKKKLAAQGRWVLQVRWGSVSCAS